MFSFSFLHFLCDHFNILIILGAYSRLHREELISGMQPSQWVADASAYTDKDTFCTAQQQAGPLHFGSSARRRPSTT